MIRGNRSIQSRRATGKKVSGSFDDIFCKIKGNTQKHKKGNDDAYSCHIKFGSL